MGHPIPDNLKVPPPSLVAAPPPPSIRTVAIAGVELRRSYAMSHRQALWIAGGLRSIPSLVAFAEIVHCGGNSRRWYVRWLPALDSERDETRNSFADGELRKAVMEGGAFSWTSAASTRLIQGANCYNVCSDRTYRITRQLDIATGELVHSCTCMQHSMSKLPCKHILDAVIRERFDTLGYPAPEPIRPLDSSTFQSRRKDDFE